LVFETAFRHYSLINRINMIGNPGRLCSNAIRRIGDASIKRAGVRKSLPLRSKGYASASQAYVKPPIYGQPLSATHPHLIKSATDLTRGIPFNEYQARRAKLMQSLPEGSKVICMGGTVRLVTQQIFYKFRQSSDFHYLTGFNEPESILVLGT
jgi:intermediate cleaving peptidase 55